MLRILVIHVIGDRIYIRDDPDKEMRIIDRATLLQVIEDL